MPSSQQSQSQGDSSNLAHAAAPYSELEAAEIEEEARERAGDASQEFMRERRIGRVEAEAHRLSEEMTRRAQNERRAAAYAQTPVAVTAGAPQRTLPEAITIKRVLAPLSSATFAERAIPYAVAVASLADVPLTIVHVGSAMPPDVMGAVERTLAKLQAGSRNVSGREPRAAASIERMEVPTGAVTQRLLELQASDRSDVFVLAPRRHFGPEGDTLGTVAQTLIRRSHAPVLVIPASVRVPDDTLPTFKRILAPLDGSLLAEQTLGLIAGLACGQPVKGVGECVREIVLLSVVESAYMKSDAARYLEAIRQQLQSTLPDQARVSIVVHVGSAPGAIVATAMHGAELMGESAAPFDLVVMATHGRGGVRRWLLGSVAEYVLTHATAPILVTRPTSVEE